jgi:hypothetical protein
MTCGARPGTGVPAASHPEAVQPWDTPAGGAPVLGTGRARPGSRRGRGWAWVLAAGVLAAAAVRAPGAAGDLRAAAGHLGGLRPAWLGVGVAGRGAGRRRGGAAPAAGGRRRAVAVADRVRPGACLHRAGPGDAAGPVTGGAWQVREYRRRGAGTGPGVWAVLTGGLTSMVVLLALLLAGAAAAGIGPIPLLACAAGVLACTGTGLLADAGVLAACFGLTGLPVPWRGLLFAYAAGQLAGRLVPLPGGVGGVEGGILGALTLTGTPPAAAAAAAGGVPGGRVLGRRRRRDRGGSRPRPPLPGRPRAGAGAHPGSRAGRRDDSRPATTPARRHRSAPCRRRRFHPQAHHRVTPFQRPRS